MVINPMSTQTLMVDFKKPHREGLEVSVSASLAVYVGREFDARSGHTKYNHKK